MLRDAGFADIRIQPVDTSREFIHEWLPGKNPGDYVLSASIEAVKPGGTQPAPAPGARVCDPQQRPSPAAVRAGQRG